MRLAAVGMRAVGVGGGLEVGSAQIAGDGPVARCQRPGQADAHRCRGRRRTAGPWFRRHGGRWRADCLPSASSSSATARTAWSNSAIWVGKTSRNRPEMRSVTSIRGRFRIASGRMSKPDTRLESGSHRGRQPIRASACARSSPPVRIVALPQMSSTIRRGQSPWSWAWRVSIASAVRRPISHAVRVGTARGSML